MLPIDQPAADTASPASSSRSNAKPPACEHLAAVENTPKPEGGCPDCLATGDSWVHLRFCVTCGRIGCCDDSKNRHATRHAAASGHPVLRTKEPDENWAWCVVDQAMLPLGPAPA
jgi:hypothetical protein